MKGIRLDNSETETVISHDIEDIEPFVVEEDGIEYVVRVADTMNIGITPDLVPDHPITMITVLRTREDGGVGLANVFTPDLARETAAGLIRAAEMAEALDEQGRKGTVQ